jgi:DNA polymerase III alpha subunit
MPDVDIDFANREQALKLFKHVPAAIIKDEEIEKHKTGVYFQAVPVDPINNCCSFDYKRAEERGYFKIDLLNVNLYEGIKTEQELVELMLEEPDWNMLKDKTIVDQLFHINGHFDIVSKLEPKNIEQLASVLAIIRPAKRHLMHKYWSEILKEVWLNPTTTVTFLKNLMQLHMLKQLWCR